MSEGTTVLTAGDQAVDETALSTDPILDYALTGVRLAAEDGVEPCAGLDGAVEPVIGATTTRSWTTRAEWFSRLSVTCGWERDEGGTVWVGIEAVSPDHHDVDWAGATAPDGVPGGLQLAADEVALPIDDERTAGGPWTAIAAHDRVTGARISVYAPDGVDAVALFESVVVGVDGGVDVAAGRGGDDADGTDGGAGDGGFDEAAARPTWEAEPCTEVEGQYGVVSGGEVYRFNDPTSCYAGMVELGLMSPEEFAERAG